MATKRKSATKKPASKRRGKGMGLLPRLIIALLVLAMLSLAAGYFILKWKRDKSPGIAEISLVQETEDNNAGNISEKGKTNGNQVNPSESKNNKAEKKHTTNEKPDPALQGTWVSTMNGAMMTIAGETFALDFPSIEFKKPVKGVLKAVKASFTITDTEGDQGCGNQEGVYLYSIKGEELTIIRKKDNCSKRASTLDATWFKL